MFPLMGCLGWNLHNGRERPIIWPGMSRRRTQRFGVHQRSVWVFWIWPVVVQSIISNGSIHFETHIFKNNWGQTEKEIKLSWYWTEGDTEKWTDEKNRVKKKSFSQLKILSILVPTQAVRFFTKKKEKKSHCIYGPPHTYELIHSSACRPK